MEKNDRVELLSPAGNAAGFYGAVHAGADAVYLAGNQFGARAYAENFTTEELLECIRYGHLLGRKIYLTVNTLLKNQEMKLLQDYLAPLYEAGLDAVIVQDLGVLRFIRERFPGLKLHVSTQMTICSRWGASLLKEMGASRIVPARELGLEELIAMREESGVQVEAFVHGAMCYCYSGQCLFSSILGGRSGNRGRCAQPCRLPYTLSEGKGCKECYPLSLKDMCTIEHIPRLIEAGIDSFKIEGRMKRPEYAAGVTDIYRRCIDNYYALRSRMEPREAAEEYRVSEEDRRDLASLYVRDGLQDGYYFRRNGRDMVSIDSPAYRESDERVLCRIRERYLDAHLKLPVTVRAFFHVGRPAKVTLETQCPSLGRLSAGAEGEPVAQAQKQPITEENVRKQLCRLGDSAFCADGAEISMDPDSFYPLKQINELRRRAVAELERKILRARGYRENRQGERTVECTAEMNAVAEEMTAPLSSEAEPTAKMNAVAEEMTPPLPSEAGPTAEMNAVAEEMTTPLSSGAEPTVEMNAVAKGRTALLSSKAEPSKGRSRQPFPRSYAFYVCTIGQLKALGEWIAANPLDASWRIYVDGDLLTEQWPHIADICRGISGSVALFAALPYILRETDGEYLEELYEKVHESGLFRGFLVRSMDGLGFLRKKHLGEKGHPGEKEAGVSGVGLRPAEEAALSVRTDAGVYAWNDSALEELSGLAEGFCLPYELNASAQRHLREGLCRKGLSAKLSCEKIVYSRIPMMVTSNCLRRTAGECGKGKENREIVSLRDRYRKEFPVLINCRHCMNIIYNSVPFSLYMEEKHSMEERHSMEEKHSIKEKHSKEGRAGEREPVGWKGRVDPRMDFTLESPEEVKRLLDAFFRGMPFPLKDYTTAHEKRGAV